MAYQQNDNSGSLFDNDRKEKETHPDLKGTITVEGKQYWISAWEKSKGDKKYLSLAVSPKVARADTGLAQSNQPSAREANPAAHKYQQRESVPSQRSDPKVDDEDVPF